MAKQNPPGATRGGKNQGHRAKPALTGAVITAPEKAAPKEPFRFPNLVQFGREVRAEARKISWPSRKETWITSVMVFIMVLVATGFFFASGEEGAAIVAAGVPATVVVATSLVFLTLSIKDWGRERIKPRELAKERRDATDASSAGCLKFIRRSRRRFRPSG